MKLVRESISFEHPKKYFDEYGMYNESLSFQKKREPKETLGIDYTVKLKENLEILFSGILLRSYKRDIKIIKEDQKILVWFDASGRIERATIQDMLDTFYTDYNVIDTLILNEFGLKLKGKYSFYSSLNPFRNTYKFHKGQFGFIAEYKYELKKYES